MKFAHKSLLQAVLLAALPCLSHAEILLQNAGEPIPDIMLRTSQAPSRVIPFTNFAKEQQNILNSLPCKWVSQNGRLGRIESNQRYDFLCKGGIWGTISLFLNQSPSFENGISNLRLHYRAWNPEAHPSAGEAAE
ncbi:MAG: hypothetical protein EBR79_03490, partial [Proteobacteria bacterium]|nr:hypothetical protein [Pseudomonadota bacterium]